MKFCTKCGNQLTDNCKFCTKCGSPVKDIENSSQNRMNNTNNVPPVNVDYGIPGPLNLGNEANWTNYHSTAAAGSPAQRAVTSVLFLVAISANSVYLVLNLINVMTSGMADTLNKYLNQLMSLAGYSSVYSSEYYLYNSYLGILDNGIKMINVVIMIPPILFCIGMWLVYVSVSGKKSSSSTGFSLARIGIILQLAGTAVIFGILLMVFVFTGFASNEIGIAILSIVMIGGIGALYILFYVKELSSLKTVQNNLENGTSGSLSVYVSVIGFIFGVISIFGLFGVRGFVAIIAALAHLVWIFSASIWMLQYKNY